MLIALHSILLFIMQLSENAELYKDPEHPRKPFLIMCPASVLYNWIDELNTWGHFAIG
jgi:SNF2 family DNA or RNA helicase